MGFYLRSSLRAGPFRFNLSRSGIGVSAGIPGFRVGAGPRGNYVRIGGLGTYYGSTPATGSGRSPVRGGHATDPALLTAQIAMTELDGASVQELVAANPTEFVAQLQHAAQRRRLWPVAATILAIISLLSMPVGLIVLLLGIPVVMWLRLRDQGRRSVVVFYDVNDQPAARYDMLTAAHADLSLTHAAWHVEAQGDLVTAHQRKVNAGASALIRRSTATLTTQGPPVLVTNVAIPSLTSKQRGVYFLPDRVLVRHGKTYADMPYSSLSIRTNAQRFIEDGSVPADAEQVGTTWQYANAKGGPDRRYKDNRQLPIMLYGRLTLTTASGFLVVWDFSRPQAAEDFAKYLRNMAQQPRDARHGVPGV